MQRNHTQGTKTFTTAALLALFLGGGCGDPEGAETDPCKAQEGRYQINADGSVKDTKTGLTWEANTALSVGYNLLNEYRKTWDEADQYCKGLSPAGVWRLPTAGELLAALQTSWNEQHEIWGDIKIYRKLHMFSLGGSLDVSLDKGILPEAHTCFPGTMLRQYWTSSNEYNWQRSNKMLAMDTYSLRAEDPLFGKASVRCVRK